VRARTDHRAALGDGGTESAGINRHIVGDERALQERKSDSILTSSLAPVVVRRQVKRRQRHRWAGYGAAKTEIRVPTLFCRWEGHTDEWR